MKVKDIIFAVILLGASITLFVIARENFKRKNISVYMKDEVVIDLEGFPYVGDENAPVTIIELSDFECPYSKKVQKTLDTLHENLNGVIKHYYKPRPVFDEGIKQLRLRAVLAAKKQNKYWDMKDKLFQLDLNENEPLTKKAIEKMINTCASELNLDMDTFTDDFHSKDVRKELDACNKEADKYGLNTVPTLLINGEIVVGVRSFDQYLDIIESKM